ncbi:unnamed protein product [Effrenium voratum]|uniref:Uncharacterized protein n=1 Tax=Effrenium voratum TaxID=2562239 RepID=A0AA36HWI7_9DINO|nr:unnamed protein product [Effrenium voratum]CAJ1427850.1 unnamed protein product [Effrenium voratum]
MDLEQQAQEMAEKALASLPPAARAAKIETVKAGILKRLTAQAANAPAAPPAPLKPPPPEAPPPEEPPSPVPQVPQVELFGDGPWYADYPLRSRLLAEVRQAHAAEKILVAPPAEEIQRILTKRNGQLLAAGAVLRLGGVHHGGYGESDINYAYRQLSRALHPDKNSGIPEAHEAFKRLGEAAEELKQVLTESRVVLNAFCQVTLQAPAPQDSLERPQGELMAEASRLLGAVLALSGEGSISDAALWRARNSFQQHVAFHRCPPQELLVKWYQEPQLLDFFASAPLRIAYDCAKKRFRAQLLTALARCAEAEARRNDSCVRGSWNQVLTNFPELGLWKALQDKIRSRVWASGPAKKRSKWDDKTAASPTDWGRKWRFVLKKVLPRDGHGAASCGDLEVQKASMAMWRDMAAWAAEDCRQQLMLFQADEGAADAWAFVPATDLLLLVGDGIVGCGAEGFVAQADEGHLRTSYLDALKEWRTSLRKGKTTTADSAVKLWQGAKRQEEAEVEKESKKAKTEEDGEVAKLNRSPTKVLLLTNLAPPSMQEEEIKSKALDLVKDFGTAECTVLKVCEVPEEEAVRVFLAFEDVQSSSKAYAALKGQVIEERAVRARFYDEKRFREGDLQKSAPSRVVVLGGLATAEDLDGGFQEEVANVGEQYGQLLRCAVQTEDDTVRVFLEYDAVETAQKAVAALHGQDFGLRRIRAHFGREDQL